MKAYILWMILGLILCQVPGYAQEKQTFNPAPGIFYTIGFYNHTEMGPYRFYRYNTTASYMQFRLLFNGIEVKNIDFPLGMIGSTVCLNWMFFPDLNYLVIRHQESFSYNITYYLYVIQLSGSYKHYQLGPFNGRNVGLYLEPSQDGEVFFIWMGCNTPNSTDNHMIIRSSNGATLCAYSMIYNNMNQRYAEITKERTVRIAAGPTIFSECPLPSH